MPDDDAKPRRKAKTRAGVTKKRESTISKIIHGAMRLLGDSEPDDGEERKVVLVVDDVRPMRKLLKKTIESAYISVVEAADGSTALKLAAKHRPDLVILDIVMKGMDGLECCRRLKADAATADVPVVVCSAMGGKKDIVDGMAAGAVDYIVKPFQTVTVLEKVHKMLERGTQRFERAGGVLTVRRDLGFTAAGRFEAECEKLIKSGGDEVTVDLAGMSNVSSACFGVLLVAGTKAKEAGKTFRVRIPPHLAYMFDTVKIGELLELEVVG